MDCSTARTKDPREWLELCPDFSWPLAERVHEWVLTWEPDLTESIKWNMLCFSGRKLVLGLSACKKHLGVSFFRGTELDDRAGLFDGGEGNTNIRSMWIVDLENFNRDAFRALVHEAVALDARVEVPPLAKVKRKPVPVPDFFQAALKRSPAAAKTFRSFAPTYQREYIMWLTTVKREESRERRLAEVIAALEGGFKWIDRKRASKAK